MRLPLLAVAFGLLIYAVRAPHKGYASDEVIVSIAPRTPSAAVFTAARPAAPAELARAAWWVNRVPSAAARAPSTPL